MVINIINKAIIYATKVEVFHEGDIERNARVFREYSDSYHYQAKLRKDMGGEQN